MEQNVINSAVGFSLVFINVKADFYSLTDYIFVKTGMTFLYLLLEFITPF